MQALFELQRNRKYILLLFFRVEHAATNANTSIRSEQHGPQANILIDSGSF